MSSSISSDCAHRLVLTLRPPPHVSEHEALAQDVQPPGQTDDPDNQCTLQITNIDVIQCSMQLKKTFNKIKMRKKSLCGLMY